MHKLNAYRNVAFRKFFCTLLHNLSKDGWVLERFGLFFLKFKRVSTPPLYFADCIDGSNASEMLAAGWQPVDARGIHTLFYKEYAPSAEDAAAFDGYLSHSLESHFGLYSNHTTIICFVLCFLIITGRDLLSRLSFSDGSKLAVYLFFAAIIALEVGKLLLNYYRYFRLMKQPATMFAPRQLSFWVNSFSLVSKFFLVAFVLYIAVNI